MGKLLRERFLSCFELCFIGGEWRKGLKNWLKNQLRGYDLIENKVLKLGAREWEQKMSGGETEDLTKGWICGR